MPADRMIDSYAIYQQLLSDPSEQSDMPLTQWLLEDKTTAKATTEPCMGPELTDLAHAAIVPAERKADWDELLDDYAAHCHDRFTLDSHFFSLPLPVRLLNEDDQNRYEQGLGRYRAVSKGIVQPSVMPQEFEGAACLHSFSAVYFNRNRTLAGTYFMHCRMRRNASGREWVWMILERTPTGWKSLPWVQVATGQGSF